MREKPIFILAKPQNENGDGTWIFNQGGKLTTAIKVGNTILPIKGGKK